MVLFVYFLSLLHLSLAIQIPVIYNVSFIGLSAKNSTIMKNVTCQECLCLAQTETVLAFNCFTNNQSCELFSTFPLTYRLESTPSVHLYFPQLIFPSKSECCMSNWTDLSRRLATAITTTVTVTKARCLIVDNNGYLVTVEDLGPTLRRFNLTTLALIDNKTITGLQMMNVAYYSEAYYISLNNRTILVMDSNNLTIIGTIYSTAIIAARDIMFLNDGQTFILASSTNTQLLFFNRTGPQKHHYTYVSSILTGYSSPHGLWYVNDSFFHATSWGGRSIYSYSKNTSGFWNVHGFANSTSTTGAGSHVTVDQCGRRWLAYHTAAIGVTVYDERGSFIANMNFSSVPVFDIMITNNYVLYISSSTGNQITRIDPGIQCP